MSVLIGAVTVLVGTENSAVVGTLKRTDHLDEDFYNTVHILMQLNRG